MSYSAVARARAGLRPQRLPRPSAPPPPPPPVWTPPFRLRHVLLLGLVVTTALWAVPRGRAAWQVHGLGAAFADYALCMAGPTGPQLLRDDLAEFRRVVRRRLIASGPDEAPFARCAKLSRDVSGSDEKQRAHAAPARRFVEYGFSPDAADAVRLADVEIDLGLLVGTAQRAWPFSRGSVAKLVRPSLGAHEAMHPVAPPRPGVGQGLPGERGLVKSAWRTPEALFLAADSEPGALTSTDGGATFRRAPRSSAEGRGGRCGGRDPERGFLLSSRDDGSLLTTSLLPNREPSSVMVVHGEHALLGLACDDDALLVAVLPERARAVALTLCRHERPCVPLSTPNVAPFHPLTTPSFDVARVSGATVLAVENAGIVRVVSSRDDGKTWTPSSVVYDAGEFPDFRADVAVPTRLQAFGSRLLLYGAAPRSSSTYPLLVSDDQGASFRALLPASEPPRVARDVSRAR